MLLTVIPFSLLISTTLNMLMNSRTIKYLLKIALCFLQLTIPTFSLLCLKKSEVSHPPQCPVTDRDLPQQNLSPEPQPALHHQMTN